jgi:cobyrinic acid a,c-diamide synthase
VQAIGRIIGAQVDLARVRELAASAAPLGLPARRRQCRRPVPTCASASHATAPSASTTPTTWQRCEAAGAELVPFDTLHDARLPAIDGLFIGGGFPEACLDALEANVALRSATSARPSKPVCRPMPSAAA